MGVDRRGGAAVNEYAANAARSRSVTFETTFHLDPTRSSEYVDKFMTRLRHSHDRTKTNKKVKKGKDSATYNPEQRRFTTSEVAADWQ